MTKYQRKRLLLKNQIQISLLIRVGLLSAAGIALILYSADQSLWETAEKADKLWISVDWARRTIRFPIIGAGVLVFLISCVVLLFWSYCIIGPLERLSKALGAVRDGNLKEELHFRKFDKIKNIATDFREMQRALKTRISQEREKVAEIEKQLSSLSSSKDAEQTLKKIQEDLKSITSSFEI